MPSANQISYLKKHQDRIQEPILIVGAKEYDCDRENFLENLRAWGFQDITGIDIASGPGVDHVVDIVDEASEFLKNNAEKYKTVICMQMLCNVKQPFIAAKNIQSLIKPGGHLFFSDAFINRIARMPKDYWRFTYDAHKELFSSLTFDDSTACLGITRIGKLIPLEYPFPEVMKYEKHPDESSLAFFMRRFHRKFLVKGIFNVTRLMPELSIFSLSRK